MTVDLATPSGFHAAKCCEEVGPPIGGLICPSMLCKICQGKPAKLQMRPTAERMRELLADSGLILTNVAEELKLDSCGLV